MIFGGVGRERIRYRLSIRCLTTGSQRVKCHAVFQGVIVVS